MFENIKVLVFDLDNTLYDADLAYDVALQSIGLSLYDAKYQCARRSVKELLGPRHVSSRNRVLYFKRILEMEQKYSPSELLHCIGRYEQALHAEVKRQWLMLGRDCLFEKLCTKYPCVILTNENIRTQLVKMNAIDKHGKFFFRLITSEEVGYEKPHSKIFSYLLSSLQVLAQECLMIGDSIDTDIIPSLQLGMKALLTKEFLHNKQLLADEVCTIETLEDLKAVLQL